MALRYEFDGEKFAQAAAYMIRRSSPMTKRKLFKLLFFADRKHMIAYGRPICGGHYVAMAQGPVHSEGYGVIKNFVVVATNEVGFLTFTASTRKCLQEKFPLNVTSTIEAGSTYLPKDCVGDCRYLLSFDDVLLSNYLNSGPVTVLGVLPSNVLRLIRNAVETSKTLERKKKVEVLKAVDGALD